LKVLVAHLKLLQSLHFSENQPDALC